MSEAAGELLSQRRSIRRIEARFVVGARRSLFRRSWLPAEPDRLIVLTHGLGEHSGRYEDFGAWFAARGAAVHAYDLAGHGRSDGRRGHIQRFEDFLNDLATFLETARSEHASLPCALVGHSMGGLIVAAFARERDPDVDCVVTSAPLLTLPAGLSDTKVLLARMLSRVWPTVTSDAGISPEALSRDPDVGKKYLADPLVHSKVTASLGVALSEGIERTAGGDAGLRIPILMLHGGDDVLCAPSGSESFFAGVATKQRAPQRALQSALKIYPELRHEIFNEPERERVFQDIWTWWTEGRAPSAATCAVNS